MKIKELIARDEQGFLDLCREHEVDTLYAFGSVVRDDFDNEQSDVDLLVDLYTNDPLDSGENLLSFYRKAKDFFKRPIDMVTPDSLKNPILIAIINSTKILIYDSKREKVSI